MSFEKQFFQQIDQFNSSPILFLGSGFSLRYLETENWEDLLRRFSGQMGQPFEKYKSKANSNWPRVGTLIAEDYHSYWFANEKFKGLSTQEMVSIDSPLKVAISDHFINASERKIASVLNDEIALLSKAKINGIITTNYDLLIEKIFPGFHVFKSQKELIFSTLHEVGEIYKIHGCCTMPNSIVLTEKDYQNFAEQNAYLAAKLLTLFLEHPTIFIGYSITDENIRGILRSVVKCLDKDQIDEIAKRLFFVEYMPETEGEPILERSEIEIGENRIPLTRIKARSYELIYKVLGDLSQKIPASILRRLKEHIYELVLTNDPTEKLSVVDFNNETQLDQVDVVVGVGIEYVKRAEKAYDAYTRKDIAKDILEDETRFNVDELCAKTLPKLCRAKMWMPVWKYVNACSKKEDLPTNILSMAKRPIGEWKKGNSYSYLEPQLNKSHNSIADILTHNTREKALHLVTLLDVEKIDLDGLNRFLKENIDLLDDQQYTSAYMRLVCLYDRLKYGEK